MISIFTKNKFGYIIYGFIVVLIVVIAIIIIKSWDEIVIHPHLPEPDTMGKSFDYLEIYEEYKPAKEGYSIYVDLDLYKLTLYKDAKELKSWPVSGGSKENPSPTGLWYVTSVEHWGGNFGGSFLALNVPWGKYGIHGTSEPWSVGNSHISHGCIRMKNSHVAELKNYITVDIPVYIEYKNIPFRTLREGKFGSDVVKLQVMLNQLGYYNKIPDGKFGPSTFDAVCLFQAKEKLKVDGVVGSTSWRLLLERTS